MKLHPAQAEALRELKTICEDLGVDMVVIGAIAYHIWIDDPWLSTNDIDIAVTLELNQYDHLASVLRAHRWNPDGKVEHRWYTPTNCIVDILPAGKTLLADGQIRWPEAERAMSLVGFKHVFSRAIEKEPAPGLIVRVIPVNVYALRKIVAYLDRPAERVKDLENLASLLHQYEAEGERRFDNEIIEWGYQYSDAGAYLLGRDLGLICDDAEAQVVMRFVQEAQDEDSMTFIRLVRYAPTISGEDKSAVIRSQIGTFAAGFTRAQPHA